MSLDVYLDGTRRTVDCECEHCGNKHTYISGDSSLFWANTTHNLGGMAGAAGIYLALWRPGEMLDPECAARIRAAQDAGQWDTVRELEQLLPVAHAADLIEPLRAGLALLKSDPARFEQHNAPNGWGRYEHFVPFVASYLAACEEYPTATVRVSR